MAEDGDDPVQFIRLKSGKRSLLQHNRRMIDGKLYRFEYYRQPPESRVLVSAEHICECFELHSFHAPDPEEGATMARDFINSYEGPQGQE